VASIRQRPDGRWRARYRDDEGKEHARHFDLKRDGVKWLEKVATSQHTGTYVDPASSRTTLGSFYAEWAPRQVWAPTTMKAADLAMSDCTFTDVEFGKLRRSHVESWVKSMSTRLAASTIKTRVNYVRAVLRAAVRDRLIASDPTEHVTLPRMRRREQAMRVPTVEQVTAVLDAADDWLKPYIALCAFAGLRQGEAAAVQLSAIDFLRRELVVDKQVQRGERGAVTIAPPKYGSERTVFVPAELTSMLSRHVEQVGVYGEQQWLFVGDEGMPPNHFAMSYWWRKAVADSGVEPFRLHDCRHFYASGLIAAGCDVVTVQRALGHSSATTTLATYSHLWPSAADRTREAAGALMRTALEASADSSRTDAG
jgi:integrase